MKDYADQDFSEDDVSKAAEETRALLKGQLPNLVLSFTVSADNKNQCVTVSPTFSGSKINGSGVNSLRAVRKLFPHVPQSFSDSDDKKERAYFNSNPAQASNDVPIVIGGWDVQYEN